MPSDYQVAFSDEQLLRTYAEYSGVADDTDEPDTVRFLRGVARLAKRRLRHAATPELGISVFLLLPHPPEHIIETASQHPMLDNGKTQVSGAVWFVGPPVLLGRRQPLPAGEDSEIFEYIAGELGCGDVVTVLFDPTGEIPSVRFYPCGLNDADNCRVTRLTSGYVTLDAILGAVEHISRNELYTPDGHRGGAALWQNRRKYHVHHEAEVRIQSYIKTGLSTAFPTCSINPEQNSTLGRLDLEVEERDDSSPGTFVRHAVLELKVLRSYGETGIPAQPAAVNRWISEGVEQASSYRDERGALQAALCCFDLRKEKLGDASFSHVRRKARDLRVVTRCWPLFPSAKDARSYLASGVGA